MLVHKSGVRGLDSVENDLLFYGRVPNTENCQISRWEMGTLNYEALAGGYGARSNSDGPDAVQQHGQNTENAPVEEIETHFPIRISQLSLIENSEGPGKFRGGLGMRRDYHFPEDLTTFTILSDRDIAGPRGIFGGLDGRKAYYVLYSDTLKEKSMELPSKCCL